MANLKVLDGNAAAKYLSTDGAGTDADPHVSHHVLDANTDGVYIGDIKFGESLLAGTNAIGKLAANSGVDIGDVTINNAAGASAVNIQDGGNTITVDGTVAATQSGTWNVGTVTTVTGVTTVSTLTTITNPIGIKNAAADTVTGVSGTYDTIDVSLTNGTYRAAIDSSGYLTTNINGTITVDGSVTADTELPAAAALSDTLANPTTPLIGAALLGWDVSNTCWERLKTDESGILQVKAAANTGVDIGDVTINNAANAGVYVREGTSASWNIRALTNADVVSVEQSTAASLNCTEASASSILTAVQLIDNPVAVLGTATYAEATTSAFVIGAVRNDTLATLVNTDNEIAPLQVDASGALYVNLSGEGIDMDIEGVAAEDANAAGNPVLVGGRYDATPRTLDDTDVGAIAIDADGAVHIADGGNTITVDGTVTAAQTTHDSLQCNANIQQGDADVTSSNELYVRGSGTAGSADAAVLSVQGIASMTPILATLQASDGTDIGNVDVASVVPGTGATNLGKAEDAAHTSGDVGVMVLGVRKDDVGALAGADGDYIPLIMNEHGILRTQVQQHFHIDEMNATTGWTVLGTDTVNLATTTNHVINDLALEFDKVDGAAGTIFAGIQKTLTSVDLDPYEKGNGFFLWSIYLSSLTDVAYVFLRLGTDSSNYNEWRVDDDELAVGWNPLRMGMFNPSTVVGNGWNTTAVTYVALGVAFDDEANELADIAADHLSVNTGLQTSADIVAEVSSSVRTPNINILKVGNKAIDIGTGNAGTGTMRVVLASDQPVVSIDDNASSLSIDIGGQAPQLDDTDKVAVSLYGKGTNAGDDAVETDGSGNLQVVGIGTAGSAAGGILTVQGVASMTPILATLQASDGTDIGNVDIASASFEKAEDAGHSTADKGIMALAVRHDTIGSLCDTDVDYTPLQVDATGYLYTKDKNAASLAVVGGGAEATALRVTIANDSTGVLTVDDGGSSLTVDGSVTADTELAAAAALSDAFSNPTTATVGAMNMVWDDANSHWERLIGVEGLSDSDAGDAVTLKSYNNDETGLMPTVVLGYDDTTNDNAYRALAVTSSGALEIADGGNTITVDGTVAATQSGTWNIGTVTPGTAAANLGKAEDAGHASGDVGVMALTVRQNSAAALSGTDADYQPLITDTNGRLHVLDANSASLAVVGGGAEATALRVTLANDSTGLVSVDDGGGTLTVDGTVTATPSGIQEIEGDEAEGSGNLPQPVLIGGDDGTDVKNINVDATTGDVQVDVTNQVDVGGATPVVTPVTGNDSPFSTSYAPSADFWLESLTLHLSAAGTTSEAFTVTLNATDGAAYDTVLFSQDLSKGAVTDLVWVPEGGPMLFENSDAIDVAWNNAESRTYGLRLVTRLA